jgi:hypothetical protein
MRGAPLCRRLARKVISLVSERRQGRRSPANGDVAVAEAADGLLLLARKLVGLAQEQQRALEIGAGEQFDWITLRRDDVTARLSSLLASGVVVSAEDSAALIQLREDLLATDAGTEKRLLALREETATQRRNFGRNKKALSSYLQVGPRRTGFLDQQQ